VTPATQFRVQHFVGANHIDLVGDVGGDPAAPTVILLHGGGQTRHSWHGAMQELIRRGYCVINLDARGHGDSQWATDGEYNLEVLAEDLQRIIATLPSKPVLVGASMGGATALYLIGTHAEPIASALVLVDIVPQLNPEGADKIGSFMRGNANGFANLEEAAAAVTAYNPHRPRPQDNNGLMKNLRLREDGRLYWHWDPRMVQSQSRAEPPVFKEILNQAASRVRVPTLLVRGSKSNIVTDDGVADLKHHLPQLEVFDVGGAGHMVAGDKNDAFNQGVFDFLRRHLPSNAPD
jgi:pimeloyl-ACP methyl ester carboxylesterase